MAIAIACNDGRSDPLKLAYRVADHYLPDELAPKGDEEDRDEDQPVAGAAPAPAPRSLTSDQLSKFTGTFFSAELDAIYRLAVVDGGLVVRIEQEPPLEVVPVGDDEFAFSFADRAYSGELTASLAFRRDDQGTIAGFDLSSGTERGITFERLR